MEEEGIIARPETSAQCTIQVYFMINIAIGFLEYLFMLFGIYGAGQVVMSDPISVILVLFQTLMSASFILVDGLALFQVIKHNDSPISALPVSKIFFPCGHLIIFLVFMWKTVLIHNFFGLHGQEAIERAEQNEIIINASNFPASIEVVAFGIVGYIILFIYAACFLDKVSCEIKNRQKY